MRNFFVIILLLTQCSCEHYGIPFPRFYWKFNFKNVFIEQLCNTNGSYATCFSLSEEECRKDLTQAVEECISAKQPNIPAVVVMPTEGKSLGRTLGKCAGDRYAEKHDSKYSEDEMCRKGLREIIGEDPAEIRFNKWVSYNPALSILSEVDPDKKKEIFNLAVQKGINGNLDVNSLLNAIIADAQKEFLSVAPNAEYLAYAHARLARNQELQSISPLACYQVVYGIQTIAQEELNLALQKLSSSTIKNLSESLKNALRAGAIAPVDPYPADKIDAFFDEAIQGMTPELREKFNAYDDVPSAEGCTISNGFYQSLLSMSEDKAGAMLRFQAQH
jgi:hypothetical protein